MTEPSLFQYIKNDFTNPKDSYNRSRGQLVLEIDNGTLLTLQYTLVPELIKLIKFVEEQQQKECNSLVIFDSSINKKFDISIDQLNKESLTHKKDIPLLTDSTLDAASPTEVFHFGGYHNDIDEKGNKIGNPHLIMYFRKSDTYVPTGHGGKFGYLVYKISSAITKDVHQEYLLTTETSRGGKYTLSGFGGSPDYIDKDDKYEQPEVTVFREMMEELFGNLYRKKTIEELKSINQSVKEIIAIIILSMCNIIRLDGLKYKLNSNDQEVSIDYLVRFFEDLFSSYITKTPDIINCILKYFNILQNLPAAFRKIIIKDEKMDFDSIVFNHPIPSGKKVVSPTHYFITNPVTIANNQMTNSMFLKILRNSFEEKEVTGVFSVKLSDDLKNFLNKIAEKNKLDQLISFMDDEENKRIYNSLFKSCILGEGLRSATPITLTEIKYELKEEENEDTFILYGTDSTKSMVVIFKIAFDKNGNKLVEQKKIISNYQMEHNIKAVKGNDLFYTLYYILNDLSSIKKLQRSNSFARLARRKKGGKKIIKQRLRQTKKRPIKKRRQTKKRRHTKIRPTKKRRPTKRR
tara:strand:- start:1387 stop:3114 length:1728 start_codon:yes stop_codon:yes gene_type:complete